MAKVTDEMLFTLQNLIMNELNFEFIGKELTGTLRMSIKPEKIEDGIAITIPAPRYSKKILFEKGYIQYTGKGSYASQVDKRGSWFNNHQGYVEECVQKAIKKWIAFYNIENVKVK